MTQLQTFSIEFDGQVLRRGFWLYVIEMRSPSGRHIYVGRTGDSSSAHAASPFSRIGQHLNFSSNAKGNSLARNLRAAGVDPYQSKFRMIALGPIFPEQTDFQAHTPVRDHMAALECALAKRLRDQGHSVLGTHSSKHPPDSQLLESAILAIEAHLASTGTA